MGTQPFEEQVALGLTLLLGVNDAMPFHYDQQLTLPEGKRFALKRWLVQNEDDRGFWCRCAPGDSIALLESEGHEYRVIILFRGAITRLFVAEGDDITRDSFVLQWVADGEDLTKGGSDFQILQKDSQPGASPNGGSAVPLDGSGSIGGPPPVS